MEWSQSINRRVFVKILLRNGFKYDHCTGGHRIYKRNGVETVAVNNHLNAMVAKRLIKEHKLV